MNILIFLHHVWHQGPAPSHQLGVSETAADPPALELVTVPESPRSPRSSIRALVNDSLANPAARGAKAFESRRIKCSFSLNRVRNLVAVASNESRSWIMQRTCSTHSPRCLNKYEDSKERVCKGHEPLCILHCAIFQKHLGLVVFEILQESTGVSCQ